MVISYSRRICFKCWHLTLAGRPCSYCGHQVKEQAWGREIVQCRACDKKMAAEWSMCPYCGAVAVPMEITPVKRQRRSYLTAFTICLLLIDLAGLAFIWISLDDLQAQKDRVVVIERPVEFNQGLEEYYESEIDDIKVELEACRADRNGWKDKAEVWEDSVKIIKGMGTVNADYLILRERYQALLRDSARKSAELQELRSAPVPVEPEEVETF